MAHAETPLTTAPGAGIVLPDESRHTRGLMRDTGVSLAGRMAIAQQHHRMDNGDLIYVFCCGAPGDWDVINYKNRYPLTIKVLNENGWVPGQIVSGPELQAAMEDIMEDMNGSVQQDRAVHSGSTMLGRPSIP
jgi:hypothetical protein